LTKSFNEKFIGESLKVLYEENIEEDIYEGYTSNYIRVKTKSKKDLINRDISTNILANKDIYLIGEI
jgi:threonylcarbamoyladenosine tRNA methylthiotransferase MtaB